MVVANRAAGSVRDRALGTVAAALAAVAPTTLVHPTGPDELDDVLRGLEGRRAVLAGGDGSLHLVVNRLLALGLGHLPLGLVPLGTGNDVARGLGLPLDPAAAAAVAATGAPLALPVIARDGGDEVVVNNAHTGVGERAAALGTGLKARLGPLAYSAGALRAGCRPEVVDLALRIDGQVVHDGPMLAVVAALGPSAGGGHELAPGAELPEPVLDVVLLEGGANRLRIGLALLAGRDPARLPGVRRWTASRVELSHGGQPTARWDVDGEARTWPSPVRLAVRPAAWRLVR